MPEPTVKRIRNRNYRHPVTVVVERPDLREFGDAGARLNVELMLSAPEGVTSRRLRRLGKAERSALRKIAAEEDPARGILLQKAALGALGQVQDHAASLMIGRLAQKRDVDPRVRAEAIASLGEIAGEGTRNLLLDLIESGQAEDRAQAVIALSKLGNVADIGLLEAIAEKDDTFVGTIAGNAASTLRQRLRLEG